MTKWELLKDLTFFAGKDYLILKKGAVYPEIPPQELDDNMSRLLKSTQKKAKHTERFVILDAEGKQRIFTVGEDVAPCVSIKRKMRVR
tara:strand:+ start:241 stop:504 length:264 start_codon:yes stop_codon:yes gene_type:complete